MKLIGITAGLAAGKTTVAKMFKKIGGKVIDADKIAHKTAAVNSSAYKKLTKYFGKTIINRDKSINRRRLAELAFSDKKKLGHLNSISHPEILKKISATIKKQKSGAIVFIDAALLLESGFFKKMDRIIVVTASLKSRLNRLRRCGADIRLSQKIIKNQMPVRRKLAFADYIIDNNGTKKKTFCQVKQIWKKIKNGG